MLVWHKDYALGVERLDVEHVVLVGLLNQLHINLGEERSADVVDPVLRALLTYTDYHFRAEEYAMDGHDYPGFAAHRAAHARIGDQVLDLQRRFAASGDHDLAREVRRLMAGWLFEHIARIDGAYGRWLRDQSAAPVMPALVAVPFARPLSGFENTGRAVA
jgi:hemerythrin